MMETVVRVAAVCAAAALLAVVIKRGTPEIAMVLVMAAAAMGLLALREPVTALGDLFSLLRKESGLAPEWFTPLYKTLGIAVVVRIGGDLCRDADARALAGVVETAGAVCALAVAAPLLERVLNLMLELRP